MGVLSTPTHSSLIRSVLFQLQDRIQKCLNSGVKFSRILDPAPPSWNRALVGQTRCDLDRLQSAINAAARLTVGAQHYDLISPLLVDLHWLRMAGTYTVQALCTCIPLPTRISTMPTSTDTAVCPVASMESRRRLRSVTSPDLTVPATRRSTQGLEPVHGLGITFRTLSVTLHHWKLSNVHSLSPTFFLSVFYSVSVC